MNYYFLQGNGKRFCIHTEDVPGFTHEQSTRPVLATSWIAAKQAFGFELTPLQKEMLK